ncbi:MAG: hypothetical protein ABW186_17955 [Rhodanobacteraceae bacterium]
MRKSTIAAGIAAALGTYAIVDATSADAATNPSLRPSNEGVSTKTHYALPHRTSGATSAVLYDHSLGDGAEDAGDFVVTDTAGWAVGGLNFALQAAASASALWDVAVFRDGSHDASCSTTSASGVLDRSAMHVSISLPAACRLARGVYHVTLGGQRTPGFQVVGAAGGGTDGDGCTGTGVCLVATVGTDTSDGACGASDSIQTTVGDQVNYCYTITNNTDADLDYHTLTDSIDGTLFALDEHPVPPGGTFQYNVIRTIGTSETRTVTWTAQDFRPGYSAEVFSTPPGCGDRVFGDGFDGAGNACAGGFIDITPTGIVVPLNDDSMAPVSMPFSFNFYGTTSNELCVDNNGFAFFAFDGCFTGGFTNNNLLPVSSLLAPAMMPLWDDFDSESGNVYTDTRGTAPNRQFIVEWYDRVHYSGSANTDGATFELILNEDGTIEFQYADVDYTAMQNSSFPLDPDDCDGGVCATVGLQNDTLMFDQFSAFEAALTNNSAIRWTANTPQLFTSSATTAIDVGAPNLVVNPPALEGAVAAGDTTTIPFAIENHGNRDLGWSLGEAPADAHFPPPGTRFAMPMGGPSQASSGRPKLARAAHGLGAKPYKHGPLALGGGVEALVADVYLDSFYYIDIDQQGGQTPVGVAIGTGFGLRFLDGDFSKAYGIDKFGTRVNTFATIDAVNGTMTPIGQSIPTADPGGWSGFTEDQTTGTLYASGTTCQENSHLYTIDRATGAASVVGELNAMPCAIWIAVGPDGNMYAADVMTDSLYAVDKTTGHTALIGSVGFNANYAQDADFDQSTGILYWAAFNTDTMADEIRTVNTETGATELVYTLGLPQVVGLAIRTLGPPCAQQPIDLPWLSLSATDGTTPPGASSPMIATIDATGASPGDVLSGTLCANSNDPVHHRAATPVTVSVGVP